MDSKALPAEDLSLVLQAECDPAIARIIMAVASEAARLAARIRRGPLDGALGAGLGQTNHDGDEQRALDAIADEAFNRALGEAGAVAMISEEHEAMLVLNPADGLLVAIDPLDGSSNIDTNVSIGTIFSIVPVAATELADGTAGLKPGSAQVAAGFVIYGPQTAMIFSFGSGTHLACLDPETGSFRFVSRSIHVPEGSPEFAINASNYRHWFPPVQAYINDCVEGADGPRGKNFNMRWIASLVADAFRIFMRGGVFLYPADQRRGYERGRLRHVYEANPIAFLIEQAGGMATDGINRILDAVPQGIHARIPFVFGSIDKVERVRRYHLGSTARSDTSPLFGKRGLLRA